MLYPSRAFVFLAIFVVVVLASPNLSSSSDSEAGVLGSLTIIDSHSGKKLDSVFSGLTVTKRSELALSILADPNLGWRTPRTSCKPVEISGGGWRADRVGFALTMRGLLSRMGGAFQCGGTTGNCMSCNGNYMETVLSSCYGLCCTEQCRQVPWAPYYDGCMDCENIDCGWGCPYQQTCWNG